MKDNPPMQLSKHQFMDLLNRLSGKLTEDTVNEEDLGEGFYYNPTRPLKWYEAYMRDVFLKAAELVTTCEQIEHSVAFMANFRSTPSLKSAGVTRLDHIRYHIENHLIRIISVGDRALILTSAVLRLGVKPRDCNRHIILNNEYVEGTDIADDLSEIASVIQPFREERNAVVHNDTYSHEDMRHLEAAYNLEEKGKNPQPRHWTKRETHEFVANRKEEMQEANSDLFRAVSDLFADLQAAFEHRYPDQHLEA